MATVKKNDPRLKALENCLGFDYVIKSYDAGRFTEYVVSMGGDVLTYRVYGNSPATYEVFAR